MKINFIKISSIIFLILIVTNACSEKKEDGKSWQGLIGAYYGDSDLTSIRFPEILDSFSKEWDEETGHGTGWSGKYVGFIESPVNGEIKFDLTTTQQAGFSIKDKQVIVDSGETEILVISADKENKYPVQVIYKHSTQGTGSLKITWSWKGKQQEVVPSKNLSFNEELAKEWNWIAEPDPNKIDYSKFIKPEKKDVIVYYEEGRFAGWPANNGIWQWGNEIAVGFVLGYYKANPYHHSIDESKGSDRVIARSTDGGDTWKFEGKLKKVPKKKETVNYAHPDFAMFVDDDQFWVSYDRAKTWEGPYSIPHFGWEELTSRTDYIVENEDRCTYFLSVEDKNVQARLEDRTFCARTTDGGRTFEFLSWIGEPKTHRAVMPSSVEISEGHFITSLRRRFDEEFNDEKPKFAHNWIDVYESKDDGKNWEFLSKVAETDMGKDNGNPPSLVKMDDGRLVLTYGYRAVPYGIRAKISEDNGTTWSEEIHIRDHAREFDIGYTRSVQRPDGKIVTVYYFTTKERKEQHIAATIWEPDNLNK